MLDNHDDIGVDCNNAVDSTVVPMTQFRIARDTLLQIVRKSCKMSSMIISLNTVTNFFK